MNDEDEVGSSNFVVRNGDAISVKLGHNRDNASAKAFDVPGTKTTIK